MAAARTTGARSATDVRIGSAADGIRSTKTVSSADPSKKRIRNSANVRRQAAFFVKNKEKFDTRTIESIRSSSIAREFDGMENQFLKCRIERSGNRSTVFLPILRRNLAHLVIIERVSLNIFLPIGQQINHADIVCANSDVTTRFDRLNPERDRTNLERDFVWRFVCRLRRQTSGCSQRYRENYPDVGTAT
jgi:hypothetical protein